MEYKTAIKKKKMKSFFIFLLPFATMWMDQEGIMLNEVKSEKTQVHLVLLVCRI